MTTCERLSERMPAVASGDHWTPEEAAHLASCPECSAEWRVVAETARLGDRLSPLDPVRISARLRQRLGAEESPVEGRGSRDEPRVIPLHRVRRWVVALAAAAVLVMVVRSTSDWRGGSDPNAASTSGVLTELDELTGTELESVLEALEDRPLIGDEGSGLGDLSPDELERVLRSWET